MKCPLTVYAHTTGMGEIITCGSDCLDKECAWWIEDINMCSVRDIAIELQTLQQRTADLREERH